MREVAYQAGKKENKYIPGVDIQSTVLRKCLPMAHPNIACDIYDGNRLSSSICLNDINFPSTRDTK
jgi:hypothetical protein